MTFFEKLYDICALRFSERDEALQRSMQNAFEEMNRRGMLHSGATAGKIKEIVALEFDESSQVLIKSAIEIHQLYYQNIDRNVVIDNACTILYERLAKLEDTKLSALQTILSGLLNHSIIEAIDLTSKIKILENELRIEIDKYFSEIAIYKTTISASKPWSRGEKITVISIIVAVIIGLIAVITPEIREIIGLRSEFKDPYPTNTQAAAPQLLPSIKANEVVIDISGSSNKIKVAYSETTKVNQSTDISGNHNIYTIYLNKEGRIVLDITGDDNIIQISKELRGVLSKDDTGNSNHIGYL